MKKKFLNLIFIALMFWGIYAVLPSFIDDFLGRIFNDEEVKEAQGFTIDSYNVILDVATDNKIDVTEEITVDWEESGHHGIYKLIPSWLEYTGKDQKTIKRKSKISNLRVVGEEYSTEMVKGKEKIKIGSADTTVNLGLHTYIIKYTYDMGFDPFNDGDEFIFHTFGDYWGTQINDASILINMPKDFTNSQINFFNDKYRKNNVNDKVDYTINGNTLYVEANSSFYKSLTVDIELPEGYFNGGSNNYGIISLILCLSVIGVAIFVVYLWINYGKDREKVSQTVEFYPPEDYDAAQIGYIYGKQSSNKLVIALIVQLASKGYIKIEETDDKKTRTIINLVLKKGGAKAKTTQLKPLTVNEKIVYDQLFNKADENDISKDSEFYNAFLDVSNNLSKTLAGKINDNVSDNKRQITSKLLIFSMIIWASAFYVFEDLHSNLSFIYYISLVALGIIVFFWIIMGRKTSYGEMITARVLGFKNYLETAEKSQLEAQVEKNPNYFYDILPYTYVLNISKKWIQKFEDIPHPQTNMGNFDYCDMVAFNSLFYSIHSSSSSSSSSSGCGGGGGCSSCGGGGSW